MRDDVDGPRSPSQDIPGPGDDNMAHGNAARRSAPEEMNPPAIRLVAPPPVRATRKRALNEDEALHEYALCRVLGHSWQHVGRGKPAWTGGVASFISRCSHCGATRAKYITRSGRGYVPNRYDYPDNYAQRGEDKLDRQGFVELFINDRTES